VLVCIDKKCVPSKETGILEQEPNDASAQELGKTPVYVVGSLMPHDGNPDVDLYRLNMKAGDFLDAWTEPFCRQYAYTHIRFLDKAGNPLEKWEFDALDAKYPFSLLTGYQAKADQEILVEVTQGKYYLGQARYNYLLGYSLYQPAANSECNAPVDLTNNGPAREFDLAQAVGTMTGKSCTGAAAPGKDLAFRVQVPAHQYILVDANTPFDSQLYLVTDCTNTEKSCVMGADSIWRPGPERLLYANHTDEDQELTLVVDSFLPKVDMKFTLHVTQAPIPAVPNDTTATALPIAQGHSTINGNNIGANNTYDTGDDGCVGAALPGRDVVYSVTLKPKQILTLKLLNFSGIYPVFLLTKDPTDPQGCLAVTQGTLSYVNEESSTQQVWLVIDSVIQDGYSKFTLDCYLGSTPRGTAVQRTKRPVTLTAFPARRNTFPAIIQ
jgi:hypothetical protein